jgi:hypothetical protein
VCASRAARACALIGSWRGAIASAPRGGAARREGQALGGDTNCQRPAYNYDLKQPARPAIRTNALAVGGRAAA